VHERAAKETAGIRQTSLPESSQTLTKKGACQGFLWTFAQKCDFGKAIALSASTTWENWGKIQGEKALIYKNRTTERNGQDLTQPKTALICGQATSGPERGGE